MVLWQCAKRRGRRAAAQGFQIGSEFNQFGFAEHGVSPHLPTLLRDRRSRVGAEDDHFGVRLAHLGAVDEIEPRSLQQEQVQDNGVDYVVMRLKPFSGGRFIPDDAWRWEPQGLKEFAERHLRGWRILNEEHPNRHAIP
jgi:hypothetical protein